MSRLRPGVTADDECGRCGRGLRVRRRLTLVAVGSGESRLAGAAEVAGGEAHAAAVRAAHVGRDVPHPPLGVVGRHGNRAAVNH